MIKELSKIKYDDLKEMLDKNKTVKIAVYIGIGLLGFYVLGKLFRGAASIVRDFNEFKSAINGK